MNLFFTDNQTAKPQTQNMMPGAREDLGEGLYPLDHIGGFDVRPGFFRMNGSYQTAKGVSFTVSSHGATSCTLLLFRPMAAEPYAKIRVPDNYKIGDTYSILVFGLKIEEFEYAYQFDGPYDEAKGKLFNKENILLDPYAQAVTGQRKWGERPEGGKDFVYKARVVKSTFDWGGISQLKHPFEDLVIYEAHVRGFTKDKSSNVTGGGTFEGLRQKIPYLKDLGINAVELMPIFEFDEMESARVVDGTQLYNYWGYNTVSFFSPNTSYAYNEEHNHEGDELKRLILELKKNGIEVILDVVFNHTAEGNEMGPSFCFKGIDNNIYYMLTPDGYYYNFSGCGNVLNCNHPVVRHFIRDCLRHWAVEYRVDGFRFDLASILGRNDDGTPLSQPPLLRSLAFDSILGNVKLIAEAWDAGGLYQVGSFPASGRWAEWNGRYRDSLRSYLKGDSWNAWDAAWSISGSGDLYGGYYDNTHSNYAGYNSCVNFLTCHDGFTLYDLYAYNDKHNEANGWNNTDGSNDNRSWNCGEEGDSTNPEVLSLRFRMIRNACAVLMSSRGTPMFLAGDEFGNTKHGNNNTYCQDNETSWINWNLLEKNHDLFEFFKYMIQFRKDHPVISRKLPNAVCGMESIHTHNIDARDVTIPRDAHTFAVSFAGYDKSKGTDDLIYIVINAYWEGVTVTLAELARPGAWYLCVNTFGDGDGRYFYEESQEPRIEHDFCMRPRSVAIFTGRNY